MNAKITYQTDFLAGVVWENTLLMNHYYLELDFITNTADPVDQNVALLRIRHILEDRLTDSYFVRQDDQDTIERLQLASAKVSELPEDPVDQVIGMILFNKISAITEEKLIMKTLKIKSQLGDSIIYEHDSDDAEFFAGDGWWNHPGPHCSDFVPMALDSIENLRIIYNAKQWRELNMYWNSDGPVAGESGNVVIFDEHKKDHSDS